MWIVSSNQWLLSGQHIALIRVWVISVLSGALNLILAALCKNKDLELDFPLCFFFHCFYLLRANWQSHYFDNSKPNKARSVEEWGYSLIVKAHKLHKNLEQVRAKQDFQHLKGCCKICQAHCFHLNSRLEFRISSTIPTSLSLKAILGTVKSGVQTEVATALATQTYTHSGTSSFLVTGKLTTV